MDGQKLVGVRSLIGFVVAVGAFVAVALYAPDTLGIITTATVSLYGILKGMRRPDNTNGNGTNVTQ